MTLGKMGSNFDFASLKLLLKGTGAEVLLPNDGEKYEKSIKRWSESCIKRAVRDIPFVDLHATSRLCYIGHAILKVIFMEDACHQTFRSLHLYLETDSSCSQP